MGDGMSEVCVRVGKGNFDSLNKTCLEVYMVLVVGSKHKYPLEVVE